jgi:hypothetical protein
MQKAGDSGNKQNWFAECGVAEFCSPAPPSSRRSGFLASLIALLVSFATPAVGQSCVGDCDSGGSVTVDELLVGLNIALGQGRVADCQAFEGTADGVVTVDELVRGVQNALQGCPSARAVKASSSVALSSLFVMDFGSLTSSYGAGAQSLALEAGPVSTEGLGGAAGLGCYTLFCPFGGTEQRCCDSFFGLTFDWSACVLADGTEVNGSYAVESDEADPCLFGLPEYASVALAPPPGLDFFITFTNYSAVAGDFLGNFTAFVADFTEEFIPYGAECSLISPDQPYPDPLGFAVRGDGTRYLQGALRTISGNETAILQDMSTTFGTSSSEVAVDVIIDDFSAESCLVDTQLDGTLSTTNLLTGREFTESYQEYVVTERTDSGSVLIEVDGTSNTDCLGPVEVFTPEPLRIFADEPCPVGGQLQVGSVEQQTTSTVIYTSSGGIDLDFGSDGTIDESRPSCIDPSINECSVPHTQGICAACSGPSDCDPSLACAPCVFCDNSAQEARCAPQDDFAVCDDGVYGELLLDIGS